MVFALNQVPSFAMCSPVGVYNAGMARWCTVTVTDADGTRHSIDVRAESTFDGTNLYVVTAKTQQALPPPSRIPVPTVATIFEVWQNGKSSRCAEPHCGAGSPSDDRSWAVREGPLFRERPGID
jgi:hypothetical protein